MKRHLLIVAIFLLAGAVMNVEVAWGCALWSRNDDVGSWEAATKWPHAVPNDWPPPQAKTRSDGFGVDRLNVYWENLRTLPSDISHRFECDIQTTEAGWPFRTLKGVQWLDIKMSGPHEWHMWSIDFESSSTETTWNFLPLKPIWPGLAVNTVFYAVVLWLLVPGPFVLRRILRIRRGLCPKCTYPMGESAVCTECGRELPKRAGVVTT